MPLGIMGAMPEEIEALRPHLTGVRVTRRAGREFLHADLWGTPVVVVFSRWGKVAAASTATELIVAHGADRVVLLGIGGSLRSDLRPGDVVVAERLIQHDLDASPFFAPTEIPLLGVREIPADPGLGRELSGAAAVFLREDLPRTADPAHAARFGLDSRRAVTGVIATGDQVIFSSAARARVLERAPAAACVEMEGGAVAQVCFEHEVPFACVRVISDSADEDAPEDVAPFFAGLAGVYTVGILKCWLGRER